MVPAASSAARIASSGDEPHDDFGRGKVDFPAIGGGERGSRPLVADDDCRATG